MFSLGSSAADPLTVLMAAGANTVKAMGIEFNVCFVCVTVVLSIINVFAVVVTVWWS